MKIFKPSCPLLQHTLTLQGFGAYRSGKALSTPLNMHLLPGTVLGVVGPNGAGKSSLLAAIAQAGVQHFGSLIYNGKNLTTISAKQRATVLAMLSQHTAAQAEMTVRELVLVGARAGRQPLTEQTVAAALQTAGIAHLAKRRCGTLSGGQLQLAQLARVLAQNTPVLLLDEPTSALDLTHQKALEQTMRRLGNEGKIVVAALHDLNIALNACTQILLLNGNGSNLVGSPLEVLRPDMVHTAYGVTTSIYTTARGRKFIAAD